MIKQTVWSPDTCGCKMTYEWDSELSEDERVHTPVGAELCEFHSQHDVTNGYTVVVEENQNKNKVLGEIVKAIPSLKPEDIEWSFDADRKLVIDTSKHNSDTADQIASVIDALK